jgi:transcriptional regulator
MYVPAAHRMTDPDAIATLVESHPLGAWVCPTPDGLVANHVPFFLDRSVGRWGRLIGHVARANPVWRDLARCGPSLVVFQGPQAYISPGWYPGKQADGKVVPTWNYAVAHAHGVARAIDDPQWLRQMLERLTAKQEQAQPSPWRVDDAPAIYIDKLLKAIVGIEITVERFEARLKASQDEAWPDRLGTVDGLLRCADDPSRRVAALVQGTIDADAGTDKPR